MLKAPPPRHQLGDGTSLVSPQDSTNCVSEDYNIRFSAGYALHGCFLKAVQAELYIFSAHHGLHHIFEVIGLIEKLGLHRDSHRVQAPLCLPAWEGVHQPTEVLTGPGCSKVLEIKALSHFAGKDIPFIVPKNSHGNTLVFSNS